MATVVVSGRVDEEVKRRADLVIAREGRSAGDIIRDLWTTIAETGAIPLSQGEVERRTQQQASFVQFMGFRERLRTVPDWLVSMTDEDMHELLASKDV